MRGVIVVGIAATAMLGACQPAGTTQTPGAGDAVGNDTAEALAGSPPGSAGDAASKAAGPVEKGKAVPKVRDRDPEEEKKKMALSRQRSDEAAKHVAQGRHTDALDHARQALRIHEQNVDAMLVMAEVYFAQKKYELVQAVTSSALSVDAKIRTPQQSSRANNLKGFAFKAMGKDSLATQAFRQAADADDKNASAWNNLGTRYMQAGDVATGKSCFQYAIELDPKFAKAHLNLGAALRAEGQHVEAEKSLQAALKLRPNYAEAYFNLGVLYLDAEPYPGLETTARLEKSITYLTRYRDLALADTPEGHGDAGPMRGPKPGPAAVSKARADDYIRVAKKGIEREQRRAERDKARAAKKASEPAGGAAAAESGTAADASNPEPAKLTKPGGVQSKPDSTTAPTTDAGDPARPGAGGPAKPGASDATKPGASGATKPGASDPSKPTTPPAKPTPVKPAAKPAPSQPTPGPPAAPPSKPAPTPPTDTPGNSGASPAPPLNKPSPAPTPKPVTPQKPSPPPVQKPAPKSAGLDLGETAASVGRQTT